MNLALMRIMDEQYTKTPFYGVLKMTRTVQDLGYPVGEKRIRRLLRLMGLEAIYPKRNLSRSEPGHQRFPYLLKGLSIDRPNQVWASDITYIRLKAGFLYLVAVMDWFSRYVLSWRLSNTLDTRFCIEALEEAVMNQCPEIFNTDQGSQFTSMEFISALQGHGIQISMDGRGRAMDNIMIERLWRSLKYEEVYLKDYETAREAQLGIKEYFRFYNHERIHQSLDYLTPAQVHKNS